MEDTLKIREARLRRALAKEGHRLCKTPARSWLRAHYGAGYEICDDRNTVVYGQWNRQYEATFEECEQWLADRIAARAAEEQAHWDARHEAARHLLEAISAKR